MRMIQNRKLPELNNRWKDGIFFASMAVLFGLLLFSRIYKLDELQQGLAIDEVGSAYDAFSLSHYGVDRWEKSWPVYPNNHGNGMSAMHTFLLTALFKVLPVNLWTVRTPVVLFSILNWIFGILIVKELSENNKTAQYLAALVMTVCPIFVLTSRMGLDCYLMLGGSTVLLWSFIRLYKDNSAKWYFISGLLSGLFLYTYVITYMVLPLLMMIPAKRMSWKKLLLFFLPPLQKIAVLENNSSTRSVIEQNWPGVEILVLNSLEECTREILHGRVDGALLMTYEAQRLSQQDVQNQLNVDIVPGMTLEVQMGVNARDNVLFFGLWNKTLSVVSEQISAAVCGEQCRHFSGRVSVRSSLLSDTDPGKYVPGAVVHCSLHTGTADRKTAAEADERAWKSSGKSEGSQ